MGRHENPLDASAGPVAELAGALRRLRHDAGNPPYQRMARRCRYSAATLSRAAAGKRLPTLGVLLAYVGACGASSDGWEARWHHASKELTAQSPGRNISPYKGLTRFDHTDHALYFGREQLAEDLWDLTRREPVAALLGPSGSGKSSLLRAGLVPRLRQRESGPARGAVVRIITPGEHPFTTHRSLLPSAGARLPGTFLIVDQFEELFTLCNDPAERERFIAALLPARGTSSRFRVVLGVRADFSSYCLEHPGLAAVVRGASLAVTRMNPAELREAIVKPAQAHGLVVERALTARLTADVADNGFALPLLSHALLETWNRRRGRTLTLDSYERAGGLHGAIAQSAEDVYTRLDTAQADVARRVLLRMIAPGADGAPDTRRSVTRSELASLGDGRTTDKVLESLTRARLITLDTAAAGLAHEVLISAWPRLGGWIEQDREKLRFHRWLTEAAGAWEAVGRERDVRISPVRLAQFGAYASLREDLTSLESDFLAAGTATHRRALRDRRAARAMGSLLVVTTAFAAALAWKQRKLLRTARSIGPALSARPPAPPPWNGRGPWTAP
ncbi:helix-turn-helix domain-containing protein [Streptomyces sp. NPDC015144]|uniref:nSTAND1 domain-containing NTPase n=1 Tax=Streptomyces sp. NPDC015144 TaxID=3364944 RepID=UPI0036F5F684